MAHRAGSVPCPGFFCEEVVTVARWSGWIAAVLILSAGLIPLVHRALMKKRAPHGAPSIRGHVIVGQATAAAAFMHTLIALTALGSPAATEGGTLALAPGAAAFMVLVAHAGVGLQLRKERLRDRPSKRRLHTITACLIVLAVAFHAGVLLGTHR
jgi:hypothetical protein